MPLHLIPDRPATRRGFLRGLAAGGATWIATAGRSPFAAEPAEERWALLADTHIDADSATESRQGVNMADHFERVVAELVAESAGLEGVVINGDCAYLEGLRGDYDTLSALLRPLDEAGLPVHLTMGNHDDRGPFYEALASHRPGSPPVAGQHVAVLETPLVNWVLLDSLRHVNQVEGEFGEEQLAWAASVLASAPDKPALLVGHHYPEPDRGPSEPGAEQPRITGLVDTAPFLQFLDDQPQAKAYIHGHSHNWGIHDAGGGCHRVNLPPTAYVFNPERPSGWVLATVSSAGMTLELRALDRNHPEHGMRRELPWR